jgi:hypothetical protein
MLYYSKYEAQVPDNGRPQQNPKVAWESPTSTLQSASRSAGPQFRGVQAPRKAGK